MELSCVGCGSFVVDAEPGQAIAISCRCGAAAPILANEAVGAFFLPFSLLQDLGTVHKVVTGHIEHYLGYSEHQSSLKSGTIQLLRRHGAISQEECNEERCQEATQRIKEIGEP